MQFFKNIFAKLILCDRDNCLESTMATALNHDQLEMLMLQLKHTDLDCRAKILQLRQIMDEACDQGTVTIEQWRSLLDRIALVQAKCVLFEPNAWRHPPITGYESTKPD